MKLNPLVKNLFDFKYDDFTLEGYDPASRNQGFGCSMIKLVSAVAFNGIIGKENDLPWSIPEDLQHFKNVTKNQIVLMGRKTFQALGRPLPNRENWVLTRAKGPELQALLEQKIRVFGTLDEAILEYQKAPWGKSSR